MMSLHSMWSADSRDDTADVEVDPTLAPALASSPDLCAALADNLALCDMVAVESGLAQVRGV